MNRFEKILFRSILAIASIYILYKASSSIYDLGLEQGYQAGYQYGTMDCIEYLQNEQEQIY